MINERFLHYRTQDAFENDLEEYGEELFYDKIAFIQDVRKLWTHGSYYGEGHFQEAIDLIFNDMSNM